MGPGPCRGVSFHRAGPTLDLDEVGPLRRQRQGVDFVDGPIVGNELEVRPEAIGIGVGKPLAEVRDGLPLPGKLRGGYLLEARGLGLHGLSYRERPLPCRGAMKARESHYF